MIISQQIREVCMKKEKGGRSYIKAFQKIIGIFKDNQNFFEEIISIRTTIYYLLTVHLEEEITF